IFSTSVGAQFGEQALKQTVFAGFIAIGLIFLFMIVVYRLPGIVASVNLAVYVFLILLIFQLMNGVLTLPGIAALILGVAMAVDARSEEHTSELQSRFDLVCRLLLEKKNIKDK